MPIIDCSGFTYRLDRLKPRASKFRGPPAKVCNISNTVIELSHLCCHNVLLHRGVARITEKYRHKLFGEEPGPLKGSMRRSPRKLRGYTTEMVTFFFVFFLSF